MCFIVWTSWLWETTFQKAYAHRFNLDIVSLSLTNFDSEDKLIELLTNPYIVCPNSRGSEEIKKVPIKSRLYVFNEIDTAGNLFTQRVKENQFNHITNHISSSRSSVSGGTDNINTCHSPTNGPKIITSFMPNNSLNLGHMLEVFDGILELHEVACIITTNHVEKIDEAFIRPGRMDLRIELTYIKQKEALAMFMFHYDSFDEKSLVDKLDDESI